jgi:hypothetical protein
MGYRGGIPCACWLDYDLVALTVLVIGIGMIQLLELRILPLIVALLEAVTEDAQVNHAVLVRSKCLEYEPCWYD